MVAFEIPGVPVAFARARVNKGGMHFTPKAQMLFGNIVRCKAGEIMGGAAPTVDPVSLIVRVVYTAPPSWSEKKREATRFKTSRPDLDNIVKLVADAMNGIVYRDDAQIAEMTAQKVYGLRDHMVVTVMPA